MMSEDVWISSVTTDYMLGANQGAREKYFNRDWAPASHKFTEGPDVTDSVYRRYWRGEALKREEMTEALFVFDHGRWSKRKDLFFAGRFYAVKGRLAEVLQQFHLGDGELIEFPVYKEDKVTPVEGGPFYLLNFGCIKDTFVPAESASVKPYYSDEEKAELRRLYPEGHRGLDLWRDNHGIRDGDIALRCAALDGCDLWFEKKYENRLFMSGRLHDAIEAANTGVDFRFAKCRILD